MSTHTLLTKQEVCVLFRCSARTFDRWRSLWKARKVDIGEIKIRGTLRFRSETIQKIVESPKMWLK